MTAAAHVLVFCDGKAKQPHARTLLERIRVEVEVILPEVETSTPLQRAPFTDKGVVERHPWPRGRQVFMLNCPRSMDGPGRVRFVCPRCKQDVVLRLERLTETVGQLVDSALGEVPLRELAKAGSQP
ncbi:hypothetical protein ACFWN7_01920 [Agromyces sp. NPDC058484]|uniref:hypothetical protein n=1 Tax=Agromyces sp. NPDC058484 TaxID=3346524 RepID=UPI00365759BD